MTSLAVHAPREFKARQERKMTGLKRGADEEASAGRRIGRPSEWDRAAHRIVKGARKKAGPSRRDWRVKGGAPIGGCRLITGGYVRLMTRGRRSMQAKEPAPAWRRRHQAATSPFRALDLGGIRAAPRSITARNNGRGYCLTCRSALIPHGRRAARAGRRGRRHRASVHTFN